MRVILSAREVCRSKSDDTSLMALMDAASVSVPALRSGMRALTIHLICADRVLDRLGDAVGLFVDLVEFAAFD